jgi:hypothetical protein
LHVEFQGCSKFKQLSHGGFGNDPECCITCTEQGALATKHVIAIINRLIDEKN